jgi:hypothetical protein
MQQATFCPVFHFHKDDKCAPVSLFTYFANKTKWANGGEFDAPDIDALQACPVYTNARSITVDSKPHWDLLYMLVYPYNFGPRIFGRSFGDHLADLEHVRVLVDQETNAVSKVYFGAHSGGQWVQARDCEIRGDSVHVYVALGTHATYPRRGTQWRIPPVLKDVTCDRGVTWFPRLLEQAPELPDRLAPKVMDFRNQKWWATLPVDTLFKKVYKTMFIL